MIFWLLAMEPLILGFGPSRLLDFNPFLYFLASLIISTLATYSLMKGFFSKTFHTVVNWVFYISVTFRECTPNRIQEIMYTEVLQTQGLL